MTITTISSTVNIAERTERISSVHEIVARVTS